MPVKIRREVSEVVLDLIYASMYLAFEKLTGTLVNHKRTPFQYWVAVRHSPIKKEVSPSQKTGVIYSAENVWQTNLE